MIEDRKILILKEHGVGLGNLLMFAPSARYLLQRNEVICNEELYHALNITPHNQRFNPDLIIIPMFADFKGIYRARMCYPGIPIHAFKYRIGNSFYSFGIHHPHDYDWEISERKNYERVYDAVEEPKRTFKYSRNILMFNKPDARGYNYYINILSYLRQKDYNVINLQVRETKTLYDLISLVKSCSYFVGTDGMLMHLCYHLNIPGLVIWGERNDYKGSVRSFLKNVPPGIKAVTNETNWKNIIDIIGKDLSCQY